MELVLLDGCANRASTCASAALNALASVDYVLAVAFSDATDGALGLTAAASDAIIVDDVSHGYYTSYVYGLYLFYHTFYKNQVFFRKMVKLRKKMRIAPKSTVFSRGASAFITAVTAAVSAASAAVGTAVRTVVLLALFAVFAFAFTC